MFKMKLFKSKVGAVGHAVAGLIGGLVFILILAALSGTIFGTSGLNATSFTGTAPGWLVTVLPIVVGAAILGMVMALFSV